MRSSVSTIAILVCLGGSLFGLAAACSDDTPTDETPDGALTLFLQKMKRRDRKGAYDLLAKSSRETATPQRLAPPTRRTSPSFLKIATTPSHVTSPTPKGPSSSGVGLPPHVCVNRLGTTREYYGTVRPMHLVF